ncbi:ATP-binding protein [Streptomyces sp. CA-250714]|uniref:ATP-binding protein n=1 Tax=Streptomyces sp. CA-250714 TaxID=3240060 RepID=UPI003D926118
MRTSLVPTTTTLPGTPRAAAAARAYTRRAVARHAPAMPMDRIDDLCLVVSELVTNAIRYGTEPGDKLALKVVLSADRARIEVHDPVRRRPRPRPESCDRTSGRGLLVVAALAESWGTDDRPLGKIVWAELAWATPPNQAIAQRDAALTRSHQR